MKDQTPLEIFRQAAGSLQNPAMKEWKASGRKVAGIYYSYVPGELFTAAGMLPVRIRAVEADGMEYSDAYLSSINCSFVRYQLHEAIRGAYDDLDAVAAANVCDHVRRVYDNWKHYADKTNKKFYFLTVPQKQGAAQTAYLAENLRKMKGKIEEDFQVEITDEKLKAAIGLHNEIRVLQRKLYEILRKPESPVKGADVLAAMIAGESLPKELYRDLLKKWLEELETKEGKKTGKRLMLVGSDCDDIKLCELIERMGATVVADMLQPGFRSAARDVSLEGDPINALADYQLHIRPQDPRTVGLCFERYEQIRQVGESAGVDGYIHLRMPMCDMYAFDQDDFSSWCKDRQIPLLKLDAEYIPEGTGQMKTRIQAFLETL